MTRCPARVELPTAAKREMEGPIPTADLDGDHGKPGVAVQVELRYLRQVDLFGLQTLGPALHYECHPSALVQRAVTARLDGREMNEDILAILALDKSKTFAGVKPLHRTCFFHVFLFLAIRILT